MIDLGEDEEKFDQFMMPLTTALDTLGNLLLNQPNSSYVEEAKKALIGIARDLRGLAFAFNTKTSYMMLFEWIYPAYTPILHRAVELWFHDPQVTTPVLKLMAELVQNRSQRLQFDVSSPNGILLFRETSKMIVNYGSRVLQLTDIAKDQMYQLKLKGVSICFSMLKSALCGGYVNFGVFRLYRDTALDDALNIFVKLLLSIPQPDLLVSCSFILLCQDDFDLSPLFEFPELSQIESNILRPAGVPGSGSHELSGLAGAASLSLHPLIHFGRTDGAGHDGLHRLLCDSGSYRHLPVQVDFKEQQSQADISQQRQPGGGSLSQSPRNASRDLATNAVHDPEHHYV